MVELLQDEFTESEYFTSSAKRQKTQRSYKRRLGTSVEFFCQFVKTHKLSGEFFVDTSGILSLECYYAWLRTRKKIPDDPQKTFRKTIQAHCRGSDKRRPFPEKVEKSLLENLRKHDPWKFFDDLPENQTVRKERRKESGFRKLGYHESLRQKQKKSQEFSEMLMRAKQETFETTKSGNISPRGESDIESITSTDKEDRYCDSIIEQVNRNLEGPLKFQVIDPGFRKVPIDMFMSIEPDPPFANYRGLDEEFFDCINNNNVMHLKHLWSNQPARCVLESFHDVTCEEQELVLELKKQVMPYLENHYGDKRFIPDDVGGDVKLLRFIRKVHHNVEQAVKCFRKTLEWRAKENVDQVRNQLIAENASIETLLENMKSTRMRGLFPFFSLDKKGDIVDIWVFGDEYEPVTSMTVEEFVQEHVRLAEFRSILLDRLSRSQNRVVNFLWLLDIRTSTYRNTSWFPYFLQVCIIDQNYYPRQNSNIMVIGCSRFFRYIWKVLCHAVDEDTKQDMFVFDATSLKNSTLVEQVPERLSIDSVPKFLGGSVDTNLGIGTASQKLSTFL